MPKGEKRANQWKDSNQLGTERGAIMMIENNSP